MSLRVVQVVTESGALLGAVERVDRKTLMPWVADFRPAEAKVKLACGHNGLCPMNDGPNRRFRQIGTGTLSVSHLPVAVVFYKNREKEPIVAFVPKKFILPLPVRH